AGVTLIELMMAMAVSGILLAGIYGAYQNQLRTTITQQQLVEMNQNLRTAALIMGRDIRMAGIDPSGKAGAGFVTAGRTMMEVSMDYQNPSPNPSKAGADWYDGKISGSGEVVRFDLSATGELRRRTNAEGKSDLSAGITRHLARNIDALDLVYLDADGTVLNAGSDGSVSDENLDKIRSVQMTVVARAGASALSRKHTDQTVYRNARGTVILDKSVSPDEFRRQVITQTFNCRNMGK
ncbi:prepilin-type N-terminal cleavage/methylation domain-containing protein, partial [Desulfosarcina sp. OttesenSCG-928-G10]|nr:prepilin-type N-terminal cleavage/methylation domain-containing protein [Desulfosarcina sp. OttesenSCG-928-G10]